MAQAILLITHLKNTHYEKKSPIDGIGMPCATQFM